MPDKVKKAKKKHLKLALFTFRQNITSLCNQMRNHVNRSLVNDGDTSETSQRIGFLNAINEVEYLANGTTVDDMGWDGPFQDPEDQAGRRNR